MKMRLNIEEQIEELGLTAPRLTPEYIKSRIVSTDYHVFPNTQLTICCIVLKNGYTEIGESACVSPENFNVSIGRNIAYENAVEKVWKLEGYLLKQALYVKESKWFQFC